MAALAPQGVFVSRYFSGRQTVAGIVLKLASRDLRPARGPHMRQDLRRYAEEARQQPPQAQHRPERTASRAQAPERKPCSILLHPTLKPPSILDPLRLGLRLQVDQRPCSSIFTPNGTMPMIVAVPPARSMPKACSAVALLPSASNE